jgi:hypothetical protein
MSNRIFAKGLAKLLDKRRVDRRREPRFDIEKRIVVTLLGDGGATVPGLAIELSGSGMRLLLKRAIPVGATVKAETEDSMMLGEVCFCEAQASGFLVGLKLNQVLSNLGELARLNRRIMGEEPRVTESIGVRARR